MLENNSGKEKVGRESEEEYSEIAASSTTQVYTSLRLKGPLMMEQNLQRDIVAKRVAPGVAKQVIQDGLEIVVDAFGETESQVIQSTRRFLRNLSQGRMVRQMTDPKSSDYGRDLEALGYFVYYQRSSHRGIGGVYRYCDAPNEFWLSRIGVLKAFQRQGVGKIIVEHAVSLIRQFNGNSLLAFTSDRTSNVEAHSFYEALNFRNTNRIFMEAGRKQRIYKLKFEN